MKIFAMFGAHKGNENELELLDAWDEYSRDENPDGYEEDHKKWAEGSDLAAFAVITFEVDEQVVRRALFPAPSAVPARIVGVTS